MAKHMLHTLTVILLTISFIFQSALSKRTDPSLEIIKHEDAEEGYTSHKEGNCGLNLFYYNQPTHIIEVFS